MFLLQKEKDFLEIEHLIWKKLLTDGHKPFIEISKIELSTISDKEFFNKYRTNIRNSIPLGTIEFTETFFSRFHSIPQMQPIEIPHCLRTPEFLKRKYEILRGEEVPKIGQFFVKNIDRLKGFVFIGEIESLFNLKDTFSPDKIQPESLYQISEVVDIKSEYRIYILNGKIYGIAHYNGDPLVLPDIQLLQKANLIYSMQKDYPKSYTMDIMVSDKGTAIIEIHTFFSCGLYQTVLGSDFMLGYEDAKNYVLRHNTKIM